VSFQLHEHDLVGFAKNRVEIGRCYAKGCERCHCIRHSEESCGVICAWSLLSYGEFGVNKFDHRKTECFCDDWDMHFAKGGD
jgi:hypothetical protein